MDRSLVRVNSECYGFFRVADAFALRIDTAGVVELGPTDFGIITSSDDDRGWCNVLLPTRGCSTWVHRDSLEVLVGGSGSDA